MLQLKYFFAFLLLTLNTVLTAQEVIIDLHLEKVSIDSLIQRLENDYQLLFSYQVATIEDIIVSTPKQATKVNLFFEQTLKETPLQFELVQQNYVIITQKTTASNQQEAVAPLPLFSGKVIDQLSQTPLPYANIYLEKTQQGTSSDQNGNFQFRSEFTPQDSLVVSYVGYEKKRFAAVNFLQQQNVVIALDFIELDENFVLVTDYLTDGVSLTDNGAVTSLRPQKTGALPGQVEPDVLSTIHFLPGIASTDGAAATINIRGGTSDQNLILWEDIPIYHSAHYFGMISALNPYIIDQVSVYRSGFDATYGGRISGVIDLKSDHQGMKKAEYGVGANFINAYANAKIPLLNDKIALTFSARHSLADLWRSPTFQSISQRINQGVLLDIPANGQLPKSISINDDFKFFDGHFKAKANLSDRDQLSASFFYNKNNFQAVILDNTANRQQSDTLALTSTGLSLSWTHQWNKKWSTKLLALTSDYHYDYAYQVNKLNLDEIEKLGLKRSKILEQQIHLVNQLKTSDNHRLKLGYQLVRYDIGFSIIKESVENQQANTQSALQSNVHTIYGTFNSANDKRFGIESGFRLNHFQKENTFYLEPRLRLWHRYSDAITLSFSGGKYHQYLSQIVEIEGDDASIDMPVWLLAGEREIPVLSSDQFQIGVLYNKKTWLFDLQTYYKKINGLTSLATGFDENISSKFHLGKADIYGIDLLVKKRWNNFRSWVSYSFSKINHRFPSFFDMDFTAPNDQPHQLHWVNTWKLGSFECSLGWKIKSGTPYSLLSNFRVKLNQNGTDTRETIVPVINEFNSARLPFQHQMDASLLYHFTPKTSANWKASIGLSLFNIYNQSNIYQRTFFIDKRLGEERRLKYINRADLGFTPNLMVRFEW